MDLGTTAAWICTTVVNTDYALPKKPSHNKSCSSYVVSCPSYNVPCPSYNVPRPSYDGHPYPSYDGPLVIQMRKA